MISFKDIFLKVCFFVFLATQVNISTFAGPRTNLNGWIKENNKYSYYTNNSKIKNEYIDSYFLNSDGILGDKETQRNFNEQLLNQIKQNNNSLDYKEPKYKDSPYFEECYPNISYAMEYFNIYYNTGERLKYSVYYNSNTFETLYVRLINSENYITQNEFVSNFTKQFRDTIKDLPDDLKLQKIEQYVMDSMEYDNSLQNRTIYDSLIKKTGVCEGYSRLFNYLANDAGLDSKYVICTVDGQSHAFNIVNINGKTKNIDICFADTSKDNKWLDFTLDTKERQIVRIY